MTGSDSTGGALSRTDAVNRITRRAWLDVGFRELLVEDPRAALIAEFGEVPPTLDGATLRPALVDRAIRRDRDGRRVLRLRPRTALRPISVLVRRFLGERELVAVLYTRRCRYSCSFCTLPSASAITDVGDDEIDTQLLAVEQVAQSSGGHGIERVALGNEGSILDTDTLPRTQLSSALALARRIRGSRRVVLETRPEFVTETTLDAVDAARGHLDVTLKIGLETGDDHLRNAILGKRMSRADFASAVRLAGERAYALESYVLLKSHPGHDDEEARRDAIATCEEIAELCTASSVPLTLRINPMYEAAGSRWARAARAAGWTPPSLFDIAEVMAHVRATGPRVYAGLSEEGLATADGHFVVRPDYEQWAAAELERYNADGDDSRLAAVARYRHGRDDSVPAPRP